jgi:hypothetical protein
MRFLIWDGLKNKSASDDEAVKLKSDFYLLWYMRGNALSDLGRFEEQERI